ncbi:MAG: hypothetical protein HYR88_11785 [Verrucomicrobia bacterium]|nr:hypothetical protein [Verrucomicrobiota bacterium]MBI3868243.1 hypothetical protein [Verrucomicrobiota bacterium]
MNYKRIATAAATLGVCLPLLADSNISAINHFAYGANLGWCDWHPSSVDGVQVNALFLSGNVWFSNCGWVSLGDGKPVNGFAYQNDAATDCGVNLAPDGGLAGKAYGANIGWISFTDSSIEGPIAAKDRPRLDLKTGRLHGYCYSANCGWIDLDTTAPFGFVKLTQLDPGVDTDGDGIPDSWERKYTGGLVKLTQTGDLDGDGVSDYDEYLAGTDPTKASDRFLVVNIAAANAGDSVQITWNSNPSRCYQIQERDNLFSGGWLDVASPGLIAPSEGPTTSATVIEAAARHRYYKVESLLPGASYGP